MINAQVILKKDKEKPFKNRHPWVFSGAINRVEGKPENGDVVDVWNNRARFVARGIYNDKSQIRVRLLTWNANDQINIDFWRRRLRRAIAGRQALIMSPQTDAYRLVHSEADGMPGLIVDQYGPWLVVQFLSLAVERYRTDIVDVLVDLLSPQGVYERSDVESRAQEGLVPVAGPVWGELPPDLVEINENGLTFLVDIKSGHKTGFYLDQRENRQKCAPYLYGKEVLNAFAYTGAFSVYAARAQAKQIINVDSSEPALQLAERNMRRNGLGDYDVTYSVADVFDVMRVYEANKWRFGAVILDPPKFAHNKHQIENASRGYKDINMLGMRITKPGGVLMTFSCSGSIDSSLFQKILFGAAIDARRTVQIIERFSQGADHPVLLTHPESEYLTGFACRVW
ncbi:MAG: class I SAM-dependent rRNA methyltransferase [Chloroflexota bacterium]